MNITGWHIDGYGIFNDYSIRDLDSGLTVFVGPNEAGKSTLLAFLQGMLFGFLDRRSRVNQYPPLRGGAHGGRLFLRRNGEDITIARSLERRSEISIQRNGDDLEEAALQALLGGADRGLFCSVFSFDLTELQDLDRLSKEGIRERIFSAGIVGAGRSANEIATQLLGEAQKIYRNRGSAQELPKLRSRRKELEKDLREAKQMLSDYERLRKEEDETAESIRILRERRKDLETQRSRIQLTIDLWPTWLGLETAKTELADLPKIDSFPSAPEERLARLMGDVSGAENQLRQLEIEIGLRRDARAQHAEALEDALHWAADNIRAVHEARSLHRERLELLVSKKKDVETETESLRKKVSDLGAGWTVEAISEFDTSLARRQEIESWKDRLATARAERDRAAQDLHFDQKKLEDAAEDEKRIGERLKEMETPDAGVLREQRGAVSELRGLLGERNAIAVRLGAGREGAEDLERRREEVERQSSGIPSAGSLRLVQIGFALAVVLALGMLIAGFTLAAVLLFVTAAGLGALLIRWMSLRRAAESLRAEMDRIEEQLAQRRGDVSKLDRSLAELEEKAVRLSAVLGLTEIPQHTRLEQIAGTHEEQQRALDRYEAENRRHEEITRRRGVLQKDVEGSTAAFEKADDAHRRLLDEWSQWTSDAGFQSAVTPEHATEFVGEIKGVQEKIERLEKLRADCSDLQDRIAKWESDAVSALRITGRLANGDPLQGAELLDRVNALFGEFEADADRRTSVASIDEELVGFAKKRQGLKEQLDESRENLARLFAEAGAEDEESFRSRLEVFNRRKKLAEDIRRGEEQVDRMLGRGEARESVLENFRQADVESWDSESARLEEDLRKLEAELEQFIRDHETLKSRRMEVEASADAAGISTELAGVEAEISEIVRRWCVYTLAGTLVKDTLRDFMKTRQPEVLQEASRYFKTVTHGVYEHIRMTEDGTGLRVEDAGGNVRAPEELSRGTAEQLYLCLRFGLAAEYARKQVALPLVMDDVLVNFDPERAAEVAEVISEVAARHQVLFFTCHPSTADLLKNVAPGARLIQMPRHGNR